MNTLFFGKDMEERKEMIIALLVVALFSWLGYKMGWINIEEEAPSVVSTIQTAEISIDTDNDGISNDKDACSLLAGVAENNGCPSDKDGDGIFGLDDRCPNKKGLKVDAGCPVKKHPITQKTPKAVAVVNTVPALAPALVNTEAKEEPALSLIKAEIDSDNDGVFDNVDPCPNTSGSINGCPSDIDSDGVIDDVDLCRDIAGTTQNHGCPEDSDSDGIVNRQDKCPNSAGTAENDGCPIDSDSDEVINSDDKCPNRVGTVENKGCPLDSDSVADAEDRCPNKAGTIEHKGCPQIKVNEEENKVISEAISSVAFISGSSKLTEHSKNILNKVVKLLVQNKDYNLLIRGHTDSSGNAALNFKLSKDRAFSVYTYLVSQGISGNRMSHSGFGDRTPIASNDTQEGRLKNRRVEFKLFY